MEHVEAEELELAEARNQHSLPVLRCDNSGDSFSGGMGRQRGGLHGSWSTSRPVFRVDFFSRRSW